MESNLKSIFDHGRAVIFPNDHRIFAESSEGICNQYELFNTLHNKSENISIVLKQLLLQYSQDKSDDNTFSILAYLIKCIYSQKNVKYAPWYLNWLDSSVHDDINFRLLLLFDSSYLINIPNDLKNQEFYDDYFKFINKYIHDSNYFIDIMKYVPLEFINTDMYEIYLHKTRNNRNIIYSLPNTDLVKMSINLYLLKYHQIYSHNELCHLDKLYELSCKTLKFIMRDEYKLPTGTISDTTINDIFTKVHNKYTLNLIFGWVIKSNRPIIITDKKLMYKLLDYVNISIITKYIGEYDNRLQNKIKSLINQSYDQISTILDVLKNTNDTILINIVLSVSNNIVITDDILEKELINNDNSLQTNNIIKAFLTHDNIKISNAEIMEKMLYIDLRFVKYYVHELNDKLNIIFYDILNKYNNTEKREILNYIKKS